MSEATRCTITRLPAGRAVTNNALALWSTHHTIHGFIEADVTEARRRMTAAKARTGQSVSLTAFVLHCFAAALEREPRLNALVRGRRLYRFDTVNVATMVEKEVDGHKVVAGLNVKGAEKKSVAEIQAELRQAQAGRVRSVGEMEKLRWLAWLPGPLLRLALRLVFTRPKLVHRMGGVTGITSIGMFASGIGWGLPITPNTVMLTVGGIGARPAVVDGRLEEREVLCLTLSFDHEVVDGAPAARFTAVLKELLASAHGLQAE